MDKIKQARKWSDHKVMVSIVFHTNMNNGECTLIIDLATDEKDDSEVTSIKYEGISNLKIGEIGSGISQFCRLDVADICSQPWNRLNYRVWDYETEKIEFMCLTSKSNAVKCCSGSQHDGRRIP